MKYGFTAALVGALASSAHAHSWVERLEVIASNGTFVGDAGFPRAYQQRTAPGFSDQNLVYLMPPNDRPLNDIRADDKICRPEQTTQTQGKDSPRLKAAAGAMVALRYQENGHVTLPDNQKGKPKNRGTVYVYGTTDSKPDDALLSIHRIWTPDGQGGDKRGALLATRDYDDGQCYQVNQSPISTQRQAQFKITPSDPQGTNLWCQTDIQIPTTAPSGKPYTLYWVWDWPTLPGTEGFPQGKQELYTTCMDIDIAGAGTSGGGKSNAGVNAGAAAHFVSQDFGNAAVSSQFANIANPTLVTGQSIAFGAQATGTKSGAPSGTGSSAASPSSATTTTPANVDSGDAAIPTVGPSGAIGVSTSKISGGFSISTAVVSSTAGVATSTLASQSAGNTAAPVNPNPSTSRATESKSRPTVSPIPAAGNSTSTKGSAGQNTATAIADGRPTVTVTASGGAGATVTQVSTLVSYLIQTKLETVTAAPMSSAPSKREVQISTNEHAYKLRARNAFAVVHNDE